MLNNITFRFCLILVIILWTCESITPYNETTAIFLCDMVANIPKLTSLPAPWKCPTEAQITATNWCSPYTGITCSGSTPPKIIEITLLDKELAGPLPNSIGTISSLKYLWFSNNMLSQTIPSTLGNLSQLVSLRLDFNSLEGTVPNSLTKLQRLTTLNLNENFLTGTLPDGFAMTTFNDDGAQTTRSQSTFEQNTFFPTSQPTQQPSRQPTTQVCITFIPFFSFCCYLPVHMISYKQLS